MLPVLSSLSFTDLDTKSTSKVILLLSSPFPNIFNFPQFLLISFIFFNNSKFIVSLDLIFFLKIKK